MNKQKYEFLTKKDVQVAQSPLVKLMIDGDALVI